MIKVGDKVKVNEKAIFFTGENLFDVLEIKDLRAMVKNESETIFCLIENLELVESKKDEAEKENKTIVFTGKVIELENGLGAKAIVGGIDKNKIKVSLETEKTGCNYEFENIQETNDFLQSLGFKVELIDKRFDLVEFLRENLEPKEFDEDNYVIILYNIALERFVIDIFAACYFVGLPYFKENNADKVVEELYNIRD